jgi:hypothetical protein
MLLCTNLLSVTNFTLGYNDGGEMLPRQGGTNSKVLADVCTTLKQEGKRQFLKVRVN